MDKTIKLLDQDPIARGRMRLVYAYPGDSDRLIKVIRPDVIDERWGSGQPWYKAQRRFRQYISYMREIAEYVATYAKYGKSLPFTQKVLGLVETDMGLGLVLEAVRDQSGNLAPSLSSLVNGKKFTEEVGGALEEFIRQILETDIVIADLHGGNIVYTYDDIRGNHFVMIDGLGLSNILPFKTVFKSFNRRSKLRHITRLYDRLNIPMSDFKNQ
ncbi:MAG: YrbL family protein [Luteolibacter sp.]